MFYGYVSVNEKKRLFLNRRPEDSYAHEWTCVLRCNQAQATEEEEKRERERERERWT